MFSRLSALAVLAFLLLSCAVAQAAGMPEGLSQEKPLLLAQDGKSFTFLAVVNGKYCFSPTRHAAVFKDGSNGDKSVFVGYVNPKDFHAALVAIGARPGENVTLQNKETTAVQGDELAVTVSWAGDARDHALDEVVKDSNGKPLVIRFGGNLPTALDKKTGCLICLDSCPVGIASNAAYTYGAVEKRQEVAFTGNKAVLPPDGTPVAVSVRIAK